MYLKEGVVYGNREHQYLHNLLGKSKGDELEQIEYIPRITGLEET